MLPSSKAFGLAALVFPMFLAACGSSVCDRESCGVEPSDEQITACEDSLADCSGADESKIDNYLTCTEDAGLCDVATATDTQSIMDAITACLSELDDVSDECLAGMMGGGGTTTTTTPTTGT